MQYCSGVAATAAGTVGMVEGIDGEETIEEIGYGKLVSWMEVPPPRRPRIMLVWWFCPRVPGVEILHRKLRRMPLMVGIR